MTSLAAASTGTREGKGYFRSWLALLRQCRAARINPLIAAANRLRFRMQGKNMIAGQGVFFAGVKNIVTNGLVQVAMTKLDFMHPRDKTVINVRGKLTFEGDYLMSQGCRVDVGPGAEATFGPGFANANTMFIVTRRLRIGSDCVISWNCMFLDSDQHALSYAGRRSRPAEISIGDRVWIGANVIVLKGTSIADRCVVAAGSVVSGVFDEPACLIAGNPARVIKKDVAWALTEQGLADRA